MNLKTTLSLKTAAHLLCAMMVMLVTTGCVMSDKETEAKLNGMWRTTETEYEDGVLTTISTTETFNAEDHTFTAEITCSSEGFRFVTVSYEGSWKASTDEIEYEIDEKSLSFKFNKSLTSKSERAEFKQSMLDELKDTGYKEGMRIISDITDTFEAEDDEGTKFTYYRID